MANEEGPQAPPTTQNPLAPQNTPPPQIPLVPQAPQAWQAPQQPTPHMPLLKWSHYKPRFSGKPDEDTEVHLLWTNDWMDTHGFQNKVKVQRFSLTLNRGS